MNLAGTKAVVPAAWMDIELAVGMVALRAATSAFQLADMWAGHWVAWKAARMVQRRVGKKVVQKVIGKVDA